MSLYTANARNRAAYNTDRFPSDAIWSSLNMSAVMLQPGRYWHWWDDFHNCPLLTTNTADEAMYASYIDTSDTIAQSAVHKNRGILLMTTAATDNNGPVITMAGNTGNSIILDDNTAADRLPCWFEARWSKSSVTNDQCAIFVGLVEEARAADNGLMADNTGAPTATIDAIGYNVLHDDGDSLDFVHLKASQTAQRVSDIEVAANIGGTVLVADDFYKTGFVYDPEFDTATRIKLFINNVEDSNYITGTAMAASTFPDGEELTFAAGPKNGEGTSTIFRLDWVRIAQKMLST